MRKHTQAFVSGTLLLGVLLLLLEGVGYSASRYKPDSVVAKVYNAQFKWFNWMDRNRKYPVSYTLTGNVERINKLTTQTDNEDKNVYELVVSGSMYLIPASQLSETIGLGDKVEIMVTSGKEVAGVRKLAK